MPRFSPEFLSKSPSGLTHRLMTHLSLVLCPVVALLLGLYITPLPPRPPEGSMHTFCCVNSKGNFIRVTGFNYPFLELGEDMGLTTQQSPQVPGDHLLRWWACVVCSKAGFSCTFFKPTQAAASPPPHSLQILLSTEPESKAENPDP